MRPQNFVDKTFTDGSETEENAKVFSLENFPLYGNKPETVLYRAPTFSLLLASHGGLVQSETVLYRAPTFSLLLVTHGRISSDRNSAVQSSHFFSSPCDTW